MHSRQLTPEQLRIIEARIQPLLGYLTRLEHRMERDGLPIDDRLYERTRAQPLFELPAMTQIAPRANASRDHPHSNPLQISEPCY